MAPKDDRAIETEKEEVSQQEDAICALHADFCSVMADKKRLRIIALLGERERTVSEIAERIGVSLQNASQHLRVMRDKGAVEFRKDGQSVYYRLSNPKFLAACKLIREGLLEQIEKRGRL